MTSKTADSIVHREIFSWFFNTSGSMERFSNCSLEKTEDLHLNRDIVFPNAQYLEGRYCQGFLVRESNSNGFRYTSRL